MNHKGNWLGTFLDTFLDEQRKIYWSEIWTCDLLFFVHPKITKCAQSVSLVVHDIYRKKSFPLMVHPLTASSQVVS